MLAAAAAADLIVLLVAVLADDLVDARAALAQQCREPAHLAPLEPLYLHLLHRLQPLLFRSGADQAGVGNRTGATAAATVAATTTTLAAATAGTATRAGASTAAAASAAAPSSDDDARAGVGGGGAARATEFIGSASASVIARILATA